MKRSDKKMNIPYAMVIPAAQHLVDRFAGLQPDSWLKKINPATAAMRFPTLLLAVALALYVAMSLVLTGIVRFDTLNNAAPVAIAFSSLGLRWVSLIVSLAAVAGIASVMLSFLLACARIWFAMSRDGLLPHWFAIPHPRYQTPHRPTLIAGALTAAVAALYPIREVAELVNIGTRKAMAGLSQSVGMLEPWQPSPRSPPAILC